MPRKDILKITEKILKILSNKKEHSIQSISLKVNTQWRTAIKCLEFLKKIDLVKERKGNITYKAERLFSLNKKYY
ncbi:MAG: hypothetical protein AABY22_22545 [Nanoarchaeota archaeon]